MDLQNLKKIKNLKLKNPAKSLQLGKVGKSTHGECKIKDGKIIFITRQNNKTV